MTRFEYCLRHVLASEGGYANDKVDRGGPTSGGITQTTYSNWLRQHGLSNKNVRDITEDEVEAIYLEFWKAAKGSYLPEPLDLAVFDCAINSGAPRAIKLLQRLLGTDEDGVFGNQTSEALREEIHISSIADVFLGYIDERAKWYEEIVQNDPSQKRFLKGWLNRLDRLERELA